jgi:uncharacterized protein YukJ
MPIPQYSVLKGDPISGKLVSGRSPHYQILLKLDAGTEATVAVNVQSDDGSEVLYAIRDGFVPPDPSGLESLPSHFTALASRPGGLAVDFVRSAVNGTPLVTRNAMTLLPKSTPAGHPENALNNAVVDLLNQTVADPNGTIYAFGSAYADPGGVQGIHDIHMNQGNPVKNHGSENGIWQDGALWISLPGTATWVALFIAFQTQSFTTDSNGNPL